MSASEDKPTVTSRSIGSMAVWRVAAPVIALMLGAFVLAGGAVWFAAEEVDRQSVETSKRLARTALENAAENLEAWVKDYAFWDETIAKVVDSLDEEWTVDKIGQYMFDTIGSSITIALSAENHVLYVASDEARDSLPNGFADVVLPKLAPLLELARVTPMEEPVGVSAFVDTPVGVLLVAAAAITPEYPTEQQLQPHTRPVLLYFKTLRGDTLTAISERYFLPELHLTTVPHGLSEHATQLNGPDGEPVAWVDWTPARPGRALLVSARVPFAILVIVLLAAGFLAIRRSVQIHDELMVRAKALAKANSQLVRGEQQARSALQRAEHATRAKSAFLAGISHELRTPLTAILGFSQILKLQHRPSDTKSREQEYAEIIHDSSQHLLAVVNDVLDLSRIESGGYEISETWVDVAREAEQMRTLLAGEADRRGVTLDVEIGDDVPALYADTKALRQILTNLTANGLKFSNTGDRVTIRVRGGTDGGLVVEVEDTGSGIAPADQDGIWEPFTRATNPNVAKAEGTGLGLHLVKILTDLHEAEVALESELSKGTRIWITFSADRVRAIAA